MKQSEQIDQLAAALVKAQQTIVNPTKNRTVEVTTQRGKYSFEYATLDAVFEAIRTPLLDNGLSFTQSLDTGEDGKMRLKTALLHESGQWIETESPVLPGQTMQELGSATTYARRYGISALLGITPEDDDDGHLASGNQVEKSTSKDSFGGPLTKTELKRQMRAFAGDLAACDDSDQLIALLNQSAELLAQCERDLPTWWYGDDNQPGANASIQKRKAELTPAHAAE